MARALHAEWLKYRRTATWWLVIGTPLLLAVAVALWVARQRTGEAVWSGVMGGLFETWSALCLPAGAGLLAGLAALQESGIGHGLRTRPVAPGALYLARLLALVAHAGLATLLVSMGGLALAHWAGAPGPVPWGSFFELAWRMFAAALPLLPLSQWVAAVWGGGAAIGLSVGGLLLAALMGGTSLGDTIWLWLPWAWPVRSSHAPAYLLPLAVGCAVLLALGGAVWFGRHEERETVQ